MVSSCVISAADMGHVRWTNTFQFTVIFIQCIFIVLFESFNNLRQNTETLQ